MAALRILALVVVWGLLATPIVLALSGDLAAEEGVLPGTRVAVEVGSLIALLIAVAAVLKFIDKRPFGSLGLPLSGFPSQTFAGIVVGILVLGFALMILALGGWLRWIDPDQPGAIAALVALGVALFANAATQEILCRGYVLQTIEEQMGVKPAIVGSSIVFMLLHAGALGGAVLPIVNLFLAGVFFALLYLATRTLWLAIGAHFGWNFALGPMLGLSVSGVDFGRAPFPVVVEGEPWITGGDFGIEGGVAVSVALLAAILALRARMV